MLGCRTVSRVSLLCGQLWPYNQTIVTVKIRPLMPAARIIGSTIVVMLRMVCS
jgi:hypothetical protein